MDDAQNRNVEGVKSFRDVQQQWNDYYIETDFGIGIQCDTCKKWRRVFQYEDESEIPEVWTCDMWEIDKNQTGDCEMPSDLTENDFIDAKYEPGSMVWVKMDGFDWWPGMIEDCPDTQEYFMTYDDADAEYHVTYFGDKPLRNWMGVSRIRDFQETPPPDPKRKKKTMKLEKAIEQANKAAPLSKKERLKQFSFLVRYKGPWRKISNPARVALPPTCPGFGETSAKSTESISGNNPVNLHLAGTTQLKRKLIKVEDSKATANHNGLVEKNGALNHLTKPGGEKKQSPKLNHVSVNEPKKLRRQTLEVESNLNTECQEPPEQTKETGNFNVQSDDSPVISGEYSGLGKTDSPLTFLAEESSSDSVSEQSYTESNKSDNIIGKDKNAAGFLEKATSESSLSIETICVSIHHEMIKKHWENADAIFQSYHPKCLPHPAILK